MDGLSDKIIFSQMFFYHRVFLNGKQILLDNECLENLYQILDELHPKSFFEMKEIGFPNNAKKIFGKLLPEDAELLNINDSKAYSYSDKKFDYNRYIPIYNFYFS